MGLFRRKKTKKEQTVEARRKRREEAKPSTVREAMDTSQLLAAGLFLVLTLLIVLICFIGSSPAGPRVVPGQMARIRVTAEMPFTYESLMRTDRLVQQRERQIGPSYRISSEINEDFSKQIDLLNQTLAENISAEFEELSDEEKKAAVRGLNQQFQLESNLAISDEDLLILVERSTPEERSRYLNEGKLIIRDILREGISARDQFTSPEEPGEQGTFSSYEVVGPLRGSQLRTEEEAAYELRINMAGLNVDTRLARALVRIFRKGLKPNLEYDAQRTEERIKEAVDKVEPVMVTVQAGEAITEPGTRITADQVEMLAAYRDAIARNEKFFWGFNATLGQQTILTLLLMIAALIYIQVSMPRFRNSNRRILLTALMLVVNLALLRLVSTVGDLHLFSAYPSIQATITYLSPVALGAIVITMLIGARAAVLLSLLVSSLFAMMEGNSMEVFLISLVACFVGIHFSRDTRLRAKVVKAGAISGVAVALGALLFGLLNDFNFQTLAQQSLAALVTGIATGMLAIGLLPLLENAFKFTSDITLLELTDTNHELLRKLQIEAPGTYHHSLMVAHLAERAASEIGANPLLCRATCLFHDIGKMSKPEYFVENQQKGHNPHDERNPTMSALIIKNHIKEGVDMAQKAKLPAIFIDVIKEHHGTTLIKYFYNKALNQNQQATLPLGSAAVPNANESADLDESGFRYDGPRPRSKESAIIFIADSIEAASRTLKKVSPQSVEDLVDGIIADKVQDGQLDESPLSMSELHKIRDSFVFTLLNMLHSRVEYPKSKKDPPAHKTQPPMPLPKPPDAQDSPAKSAVM